MLESPISFSELKDTSDSMPKAKALGLDGIPPELLLCLWDLVGPVILDSIKFLLSTGSFNRDQKIALISLLLKKGKDPLEGSSHRPISILNSNFKLFAKVFCQDDWTPVSHPWFIQTKLILSKAECLVIISVIYYIL